MKTYYFNLQSKGGSGKSMLTYLQALKHGENDRIAFIDLDAASHTSARQLAFVSTKERLFQIELLDDIKRIDREKFFKMIEGLNETAFAVFYVDFGSSESEQLLQLFKMDFSKEDLKLFEQEMKAKFIFNIVIAGGTSYEACFNYLKQVVLTIGGLFDLILYANEYTFKQQPALMSEIRDFMKSTKGLIKESKPFGNIYTERQSGVEIIANIKNGLGMEGYKSFAARAIIKKEIDKI